MRPLFLFTTGALLAILLLEVLFRILPVSTSTRTGYYIQPHILTYPANHCFTISTGWDLRSNQNHCANNLGFIANRDFVYNPKAIALIGDSFVEANMLPASKGLAAEVETRLGGRAVFALGGPGSNLLDYAERAQFAESKFGIKTFVIAINRTDIRESLCGSGNIHAHCIETHTLNPIVETQPPPSKLKHIFRQSAFAQYVISQLKLNPAQLFSKVSQQTHDTDASESGSKPSPTATDLVTKTFFSRLPAADGIRYYLVIDPDRAHLFGPATNAQDLDNLITSAQIYGATHIDPTKEFQEFVHSRGIALEVSPSDKHWNTAAIGLVANAIADKLKSEGY